MQNPINLLLYQMVLNFLLVVLIGLIIIPLGLYTIESISLENIILIAISSAFLFFGVITLYYGLSVGNVSVGSLILSSRVIISILLAILFLSEIFPFNIYFWIVIVIIGILLTSWQEKLSLIEGLKNSGSVFFFITIILWGIGNTIIGAINNEVFIISFLIIRLFVMNFLLILLIIFLILVYPKLIPALGDVRKISFSPKYVIFIFLFVLVATFGDGASIVALGESVTITEAIGAFQGVLVFLIVLLLSQNRRIKEIYNEPMGKITLLVRSTGFLIATIAIVILTFDLSSLNI